MSLRSDLRKSIAARFKSSQSSLKTNSRRTNIASPKPNKEPSQPENRQRKRHPFKKGESYRRDNVVEIIEKRIRTGMYRDERDVWERLKVIRNCPYETLVWTPFSGFGRSPHNPKAWRTLAGCPISEPPRISRDPSAADFIADTSVGTKLWALCANPSRYRIRDAVEHLEVDYWTIGRTAMHRGDKVAIWQTRDNNGRRGIVALGQVIMDPTIRSDLDNPFWITAHDARAKLPRVPVRYQRLSPPVWVDNTDTGEFLASLSVARAQGGTVFRLTDEQWARLVNLAGGFMTDDPIVAEVGATARGASRRGMGQGFGLSVAERAAVEVHAMTLAKRYYEAFWPSVADVSGNCSFDLLCRSATSELRVEVKGTTSVGDQIVLTKREVDEAILPGYALFVVSDIALTRTGESVYAAGGQCRMISQWRQNRHRLKPIAYLVTLDWSEGKTVT